MVDRGEPAVDAAGLVVPLAGRLVATGDRWEPYRLLDSRGMPVDAARAYFGHLQAAGRSEATIRSYGLDLLRWFRFLWAAGVSWDQATRAEAREFSRRLQVTVKPGHGSVRIGVTAGGGMPGTPNLVTGKPAPGA